MPQVIEQQPVMKASSNKLVSVISVTIVKPASDASTVTGVMAFHLATPSQSAVRSEEDRAVEALGLEAFAADWESDADSIYDDFLEDADLQ